MICSSFPKGGEGVMQDIQTMRSFLWACLEFFCCIVGPIDDDDIEPEDGANDGDGEDNLDEEMHNVLSAFQKALNSDTEDAEDSDQETKTEHLDVVVVFQPEDSSTEWEEV